MTTPYIGQDAYNKFDEIENFSYNCIQYLMQESELMWKLLKYNEPDAWNKSNLTHAEKADMIYDGTEDSTKYKVFLDPSSPDTFIHEISMLRIYPYFFAAQSRSVGYVELAFDVLCHYKINHLTNYKTRTLMMTKEIIRVFNGADIGGLGLMFLDRSSDQNTKGAVAFQTPMRGMQMILATNVAVR